MASIRELPAELQYKANAELNENQTSIEENLKHIRDWLSKKPHLKVRQDDQSLVNFGRGCKWNLERMKSKIENFYTFRTLVPEYFGDRDPFSPEIQSILKSGCFCPLPNRANPLAPKIIFYNFANVNLEEIPNFFVTGTKYMFMCLEILMQEDDNFIISGLDEIADYKYFTYGFFSQCKASLMIKHFKIVEEAYPLRFKRYMAININSVFDAIFTLCKPFISEKIKERLFLFSEGNIDNAYKQFDKSLFPIEYGGENGSLVEITKEWKLKVESYRDWFLDDAKYKSDEKLRIRNFSYNLQDNEMDGTFRKLIID